MYVCIYNLVISCIMTLEVTIFDTTSKDEHNTFFFFFWWVGGSMFSIKEFMSKHIKPTLIHFGMINK